jgi:hypothetical protein
MLKTVTKPTPADPAAVGLNRYQSKCENSHHPRRDETHELPNQFLIDTPAIRNGSNSLKTNESDPF